MSTMVLFNLVVRERNIQSRAQADDREKPTKLYRGGGIDIDDVLS